MKRNLTFIFILVLSVTFFFCKKKESENITSSTTSTSGIPVTPTSTIYGRFDILKEDILSTGSSSVTSFSMQPIVFVTDTAFSDTLKNDVTNVNLGRVSLNGIVLKRTRSFTGTDSTFAYQDTTSTNFSFPYTWSFSGGVHFSAWTFTNAKSFSTYTGYASLPDTIHIGTGQTIPVLNYSNADEIEVTLYSYMTGVSPVTKRISPPQTSVTFSASDLAAFPTTNCVMHLNFYRNNYQQNLGKTYNYRMNYRFVKTYMFVRQ